MPVLHAKRSFALLSKRLLYILFGVMVSVACEKAPAPDDSRAPAGGPGDSIVDSTSAASSGEKTKESKRLRLIAPDPDAVKNPVLRCAYTHASFEPKKWLTSDYLFLRRPNRRQISAYDHIIKKMARRYGFDWRLIAAQIFTESNFRHEASSHAGAIGLMQVLPSTAEFMGADPNALITPEVNIAVGCMYNQRMYSLWGRQTKDRHQRLAFAFASYNAGRRRVLRAWRKDSLDTWCSTHTRLPAETQSYVHKIHLKWDQYRRELIP